MKKILFLAMAVLLFYPVSAEAKSKSKNKVETEEKVTEEIEKKESGNVDVETEVDVDKGALHQAVDHRYRFSKRLQSEFSPFGGFFLGDETHNSWMIGARYFLHLNNTFALGASYAYTPIVTDMSSTFGRSLRSKDEHIIDGEVMISNDAAFRVGKSVVECDLYLTLGVGVMRINRYNKPVGIIGGGLKVYTGLPWLAVRFDVNSYLHRTPNPTGDTFDADISMLGGVSFLFPDRTRQKKNEEQDLISGSGEVDDS